MEVARDIVVETWVDRYLEIVLRLTSNMSLRGQAFILEEISIFGNIFKNL